mmetsp:Transcript_153769/g.294742  ORF Transcript_153769/g.294742 Transcript_153769/m.294742 type:complete len:258 (-) Transcript_153769:37-810(-)
MFGSSPMKRKLSRPDHPQMAAAHEILPAAKSPCSAAVVWLHGFGDGPDGWVSSLEQARVRHPNWKWVHLRAPALPQPCYRGVPVPSWGDYHDPGCTRVGSADYDNEDIVSEATLAEVHRIVDELEDSDGIPADRVMIGGFSMGATAAAETALRYPKRLGGLVVLNGWLTPAARRALDTTASKGMRVLVSHGSEDEQVGFDCGEAAVKLFKEAGVSVTFEVQPGLKHVQSGFGPGRDLAAKFLADVLGPCEDESSRVG